MDSGWAQPSPTPGVKRTTFKAFKKVAPRSAAQASLLILGHNKKWSAPHTMFRDAVITELGWGWYRVRAGGSQSPSATRLSSCERHGQSIVALTAAYVRRLRKVVCCCRGQVVRLCAQSPLREPTPLTRQVPVATAQPRLPTSLATCSLSPCNHGSTIEQIISASGWQVCILWVSLGLWCASSGQCAWARGLCSLLFCR